MSLFQQSVLKKQITANADKINRAYQLFVAYFHNPDIQETIRSCKEEEYQEGFLRALFVNVLDYTLKPDLNYNLVLEKKNEKDGEKADGAMLLNGEVIGVIELKDTKKTDFKKIEKQAFGYKNSHRKAIYVITSNFEKLRFYIDNAVDYEEFNLFTLTKERFAVLWLALAHENIAKDLPKQLKTESVGNEDQITKQLYKDYATFKRALFADMTEQNPDYDRLTLFKKSQKILDRILFILFAEDCGLLPPNSVMEIVKQWQRLKDEDDVYFPLYDRLKLYFGYMNTGRKGAKHDIFAYNGGLFAPDEVLDNVVISDETLLTHLTKVSNYDFSSEVDVNILGHIFENSLTEIEEITNEIITGEKQVSKRKTDGVFYTPRYITTYIVENTVGKLCADKKAELEIVESDYFADKSLSPKKRREVQTRCFASLQAYRDWLLSLTICDPACGSGAFLNATLDFLIAEHKLIDEMTAKLTGGSIVFSEIENAILENNLYGVDINDESVEIAKLSLWLRTAKPNRKLNSLNNNIKCGNSLISDPEIAGEKAFDWQKEFPQVFEKGGFDVIVGNPPWGAKVPKNDKEHINRNYICKKGELETYVHFIDLIINKLLKRQGLLGLITPNTWYYLDKYIELRKLLLDKKIVELIELEKNIFEDAPDIVPGVFIVANLSEIKNYGISTHILRKGNIPNFLVDSTIMDSFIVQKDDIVKFENLTFNLKLTKEKVALLKKISNNSVQLSDYYNVRYGIKTGNNNKYVSKTNTDNLNWKLCIASASGVKKYLLKWEGDYLDFGQHLSGYSNNSFEKPKILIQYIRKLSMDTRIVSTLDKEGSYYPLNNFSFVEQMNDEYGLEYLLAVLNSKAINYFFKNTYIDYNIKPKYIGLLPIKAISKENQQPFIALADKMLSLNSELQTKRHRFLKRLSDNFVGIKITGKIETFDELEFSQFIAELKKQKVALTLKQQDEWEEYFDEYKMECNALSAQISETDKEIDRLVYGLYGITENEINLIEK